MDCSSASGYKNGWVFPWPVPLPGTPNPMWRICDMVVQAGRQCWQGPEVVKTRHEQECRRRLARLQTGKCSVCTRHR